MMFPGEIWGFNEAVVEDADGIACGILVPAYPNGEMVPFAEFVNVMQRCHEFYTIILPDLESRKLRVKDG